MSAYIQGGTPLPIGDPDNELPEPEERTCGCGNTFMTAVDSPPEQGCWDCAPPITARDARPLRVHPQEPVK